MRVANTVNPFISPFSGPFGHGSAPVHKHPNNFKFCTVNANQQPLVLHDTLASSTHDFLGGDCAHSTRYYSLAHENVNLGSNQPVSRFWQRGLFPSTKQGSFSLLLTLCSAPCSAPALCPLCSGTPCFCSCPFAQFAPIRLATVLSAKDSSLGTDYLRSCFVLFCHASVYL